jgi:timeless
MEWLADLESTCAALGSSDGVNYYKDEECLECVKDLIRFIRRDDAAHVLRRNLGQIGVVQSDLIPLLRDFSSDPELFDLVLRLLVNLTGNNVNNFKIFRTAFL